MESRMTNQSTCLFEDRKKLTAYNGSPSDTIRGGDFVECSNGHKEANLTRGYDPVKGDYYLEGRCTHKGCGIKLRLYDKERRQ
jgi:hypothetical protein